MSYVLNAPRFNPRYKQRRRMRSMLRKHGKNCAYCEREMTKDGGYNGLLAPSRDHVIPLSRGGPDTFDNIVMACRECNEMKGSLDGEEFMAWRAGVASRLHLMNAPRLHKPYNIWDAAVGEWKPNPKNATWRPRTRL